MESAILLDLARSCIRLTTPILLAALGATICNRAGILNFSLEGKMLLGSFIGILATYWLGNSALGLVAAMVAGGMLGAIFAFLFIRYKVDLVIMAIAINMFVLEITVFLLRSFFGGAGTWSDPSIVQLPDIQIPLIHSIPVIGPLISGHNIIVYIAWLTTILMQIVIFRTKLGRHIRAVGENPEAAKAVGINVARMQFIALVISGALAALGGAFLSIGHLTLFTRNLSNNRGFVGFSAALFGMNNPLGVFFSSLLFGSADAIAMRLQMITDIPPSIIQFFPNVLTILALVIVAMRVKGRETITRLLFRSQLLKRLENPDKSIDKGNQ